MLGYTNADAIRHYLAQNAQNLGVSPEFARDLENDLQNENSEASKRFKKLSFAAAVYYFFAVVLRNEQQLSANRNAAAFDKAEQAAGFDRNADVTTDLSPEVEVTLDPRVVKEYRQLQQQLQLIDSQLTVAVSQSQAANANAANYINAQIFKGNNKLALDDTQAQAFSIAFVDETASFKERSMGAAQAAGALRGDSADITGERAVFAATVLRESDPAIAAASGRGLDLATPVPAPKNNSRRDIAALDLANAPRSTQVVASFDPQGLLRTAANASAAVAILLSSRVQVASDLLAAQQKLGIDPTHARSLDDSALGVSVRARIKFSGVPATTTNPQGAQQAVADKLARTTPVPQPGSVARKHDLRGG